MKVKMLPRFIMNAGELLTTASRIGTILKDAPTRDTYLHEMLSDLAGEVAQVREVYYSDSGARARTANLNAARKALNARLSSTGNLVRGLRYSPDTTVAGAASDVYALLKTHQFGARGRNGEVQSAVVGSMLRRLTEPDMGSRVDTAGARAAIGLVAEAYDEFERTYRENLANARKPTPMKLLLAPVRQSLLDIITYLNRRGQRTPEVYGRLNASVNALVVEVGTKARARRTRKRLSAGSAATVGAQSASATPSGSDTPAQAAANAAIVPAETLLPTTDSAADAPAGKPETRDHVDNCAPLTKHTSAVAPPTTTDTATALALGRPGRSDGPVTIDKMRACPGMQGVRALHSGIVDDKPQRLAPRRE